MGTHCSRQAFWEHFVLTLIVVKIRLEELRILKNLTQAQLAREIGINKRSISHYEAGKRQPDYATVKKFCDFFVVSADYFLGFKDEY